MRFHLVGVAVASLVAAMMLNADAAQAQATADVCSFSERTSVWGGDCRASLSDRNDPSEFASRRANGSSTGAVQNTQEDDHGWDRDGKRGKRHGHGGKKHGHGKGGGNGYGNDHGKGGKSYGKDRDHDRGKGGKGKGGKGKGGKGKGSKGKGKGMDTRPGNGYGDVNHDHTGAPGQSKNKGNNGQGGKKGKK